jgi:hypothetical protein
MLPNGCSGAPALLVQAQRRCPVLSPRVPGPAWQSQGAAALGPPSAALRHHHDRGAGHLRAFAAPPPPPWAPPGQPPRPGPGPGGGVPHRHGGGRAGRDAGPQRCHGHVWPRPLAGRPPRSLEDNAGGLQGPGLLRQTAPGFVPVARQGPPRCRERPPLPQEDTHGAWGWQGGCPYREAESEVRPTLLVALLPVRRCPPAGGHCLMDAGAVLRRRRAGAGGTGWVATRVPLRARVLAAREPEGHGKTPRPTDIMTRDGMMRAGIGGVARGGMAGPSGDATAHRLTHGIIEDPEPVSLRTADLLGGLEARDAPPVMAAVLEPRRFRAAAGEGGVVRPLEPTAGEVRPAGVGPDDQPGQVILAMLQLAPMRAEVPEDLGMRGHEGSGGHDRQRHQAFPFHVGGGRGPESITRKSEMANHNSRDLYRYIGVGLGGVARHKGLMKHTWPAIVVCLLYPRSAPVPPRPQFFSSLVPRTAVAFSPRPRPRHPRRPRSSQLVKHTSCLLSSRMKSTR